MKKWGKHKSISNLKFQILNVECPISNEIEAVAAKQFEKTKPISK